MAGDAHGIDNQEEVAAQAGGQEGQQAQEGSQVAGTDYEKAIAERDGRIAELKAQGEGERIDFALQLAGVRNVKTAKALLDDYDGDIQALKAAEQWLFSDAPAKQSGKTGLPNAGTASDNGKVMKCWRRLAGLDDPEDEE